MKRIPILKINFRYLLPIGLAVILYGTYETIDVGWSIALGLFALSSLVSSFSVK